MKYKIITGLVFLVLLVASFVAGRMTSEIDEKIKIVTQTETEFEYIKEAKTLDDYKECYNKKLGIFASVRGDSWVDIIALDGCKKAEKSIKINSVDKKNLVIFNAGYKFVQVNYFRKWNSRIFIGAGVSYPLNAHLGVGYSF